MSDAMTNREIEDVLTSIRRLVAQEGGRGAEVGRLILTAAQRVNTAAREAEAEDVGPAADAADASATLSGILDEAHVSIPAPDFSKLEATIAELEAAVSASGDYEAEATPEGPRASNVTELYGRLNFVHRAPDPEADAAPEALASPQAEGPEAEPVAAEAPGEGDAVSGAEQAAYVGSAPHDQEPQEAQAWTAAESDADEDDAVLDEETLRLLIAQIVRDELRGQLGERLTHLVRKLVRAEIAKALDERTIL